eukprot:TRINITY_DN11088_c0_g2_i2.p1 TRINITY_DN11088_c0_g2~~TRINITY_DN11088_c0_g2_i2.p1  ORF type:complete len:354 (+),score=139.48 TRINITY_DN11088_c0_g2_i2:74-1135(+)
MADIPQLLKTDVTEMLRIKHPVLLAGMFGVSNHELAAAVTNAGGLGSIGGLTMTPMILRKEIQLLKERITGDKTQFGVDLAWPKVGEGARKTNYDYTKGNFPKLIDIMIEEKCRLFICAIGVPPKWAVDKLHAGGVTVMNMIGSPKHIKKCQEVGVDIICCQGYEAGGHTGDVATFPLIPQCLDEIKRLNATSPLHKCPCPLIGAGGIYDGRGVAGALTLGAKAVWVGTRFVATPEASAKKGHREAIVSANAHGTVRTLIFSGRPVRCYKSEYVRQWEDHRQEDIRKMCDNGIIPVHTDKTNPLKPIEPFPMLFGQACGGIHAVEPAGKIVRDMVVDAARILQETTQCVVAKL